MSVLRNALVLVSTLAILAPACDSSDDGGNGDAILTGCALNFAVTNAGGKDFGASCTSDAECMFGECMMPGDKGNITNAKFGFCTRGCDCNNNEASRIPADQKEGGLECIYPTDGAGGLKDFHHVAIECTDLAECQGIDAQWTSCELPDNAGARNVCHAL